jgi:hypothetical protein
MPLGPSASELMVYVSLDLQPDSTGDPPSIFLSQLPSRNVLGAILL